MSTELTRQIRRLKHGDHSCLIYESAEQQRAAMVPFFKEGLSRGERCMYIADDRTVDEVKGYMAAAGIDVAAEIARGAFKIVTKRETYLKDGAFDPRKMVATLGETLDDALSQGFAGLRGSGEMTWALGTHDGCAQAIEYEALLNEFFPKKQFVALCQYNRTRFPAAVMLDVLRTHPFAVIGEQVCPNLYYEPTAMVLESAPDEARLQWRIDQLQRARSAVHALEEAIRARDAFFTVAAHELRTPLTAVRLDVDAALRRIEQGDSSRYEHRLSRISTKVGQLEDLIERVLDIDRLGGLELELSPTTVDLAQAVHGAVARHRQAATAAGCLLHVQVQPVVGHWDRRRIDQMLDHLVANALKFGHGKPVRISLSSAGRDAILSIQDGGIGIAAVDHPRLFTPFARAVSESNYSGFGMGLWAVRCIVEAHGGTVGVDSELGAGATFRVVLPRPSTPPRS